MFGRERIGLENDEVALADAIVTLPVNPAFASLNLAQAVVIVAYEWFKLAGGGELPFSEPDEIAAGGQAAVRRLLRRPRARAGKGRVLPPGRKARHHAHQPAQHLPRAWTPTQQDIRTLHGVITAIAQGRKGPARGGVLDSEEAQRLRDLIAEHGAGRVPGERGPVRGLARLLRRNPTEAERMLVAGAHQ